MWASGGGVHGRASLGVHPWRMCRWLRQQHAKREGVTRSLERDSTCLSAGLISLEESTATHSRSISAPLPPLPPLPWLPWGPWGVLSDTNLRATTTPSTLHPIRRKCAGVLPPSKSVK